MATFAIDPAHTDVLFSAKHMMVTTVRGTFPDVTGTIELDETDPTALAGRVPRRGRERRHGLRARDTHLRSADFFDAETLPEIRFISTASGQGGNDYVVTGRPHDPRRHQAGRLRRRVRRHRQGHERRPARRLLGDDEGPARGLGPQLERRPRAGWLARRDKVKLEVDVAVQERSPWPRPPDARTGSGVGSGRVEPVEHAAGVVEDVQLTSPDPRRSH